MEFALTPQIVVTERGISLVPATRTETGCGVSFIVRPAMVHGGEPTFDGALWIGEVQDDLPTAVTRIAPPRIVLADSGDYRRARLLVRSGRHLRGFVELAIENGGVDPVALAEAIRALPTHDVAASRVADDAIRAARKASASTALPTFSVVLCTRDRPEALRAALGSLMTLDYPTYEVVVVDNASRTDATATVVAEFAAVHGEERVRFVREPRPGLAKARNTGVLTARNDLIAFTDDDVVVDAQWLTGLAGGFARGSAAATRQDSDRDAVGCVTGIVPSGELRGRSQLYFERRVWWSSSLTPQLYSMAAPPAGEPLFPFRVGLYGTGANFAVRRSVLMAIGGFDEALGIGSPTGGGEDIDMFVRVLHAGHALAYEPSAVIWHRHREDSAALLHQASGYGLGLGAWLTVIVFEPRMVLSAARRAVKAARHIITSTKVDADEAPADGGAYAATVRRAELLAVLRGPVALLRARLAGARRRPLRQQHDRSRPSAGAPTTTGV